MPRACTIRCSRLAASHGRYCSGPACSSCRQTQSTSLSACKWRVDDDMCTTVLHVRAVPCPCVRVCARACVRVMHRALAAIQRQNKCVVNQKVKCPTAVAFSCANGSVRAHQLTSRRCACSCTTSTLHSMTARAIQSLRSPSTSTEIADRPRNARGHEHTV